MAKQPTTNTSAKRSVAKVKQPAVEKKKDAAVEKKKPNKKANSEIAAEESTKTQLNSDTKKQQEEAPTVPAPTTEINSDEPSNNNNNSNGKQAEKQSTKSDKKRKIDNTKDSEEKSTEVAAPVIAKKPKKTSPAENAVAVVEKPTKDAEKPTEDAEKQPAASGPKNVAANKQQVLKAIKALANWFEKEKVDKAELFTTGDEVQLIIKFFNLPKKYANKPKTIKLPHDVRPLEDNKVLVLCHNDNKKAYKELIEKEGLSGNVVVHRIQHLKKNFNTFELQRNLFSLYQVILADSSVVKMVPKLIGKKFLAAQRDPFVIKNSSKLIPTIKSAQRAARIFLRDSLLANVHIGSLSLGTKAIHENAMAVLDGVNNLDIPAIATVHVKLTSSPALQVFLSPKLTPEAFLEATKVDAEEYARQKWMAAEQEGVLKSEQAEKDKKKQEYEAKMLKKRLKQIENIKDFIDPVEEERVKTTALQKARKSAKRN